MSGSPLITVPQAPASPPNSVVEGDGWWPNIDCTATRTALRIGEFVTHARLVNAIEGAVLDVTGDLSAWAAQLVAAGAGSLSAVTVDHLLTLKMPCRRPSYTHLPSDQPRYTANKAAWLAAPVGDAPRLVQLYLRAVRYAATAHLAEEYRDLAVTAAGQPRVDVMEYSGETYRRTSIQAVRDMLGITRVSVALI